MPVQNIPLVYRLCQEVAKIAIMYIQSWLSVLKVSKYLHHTWHIQTVSISSKQNSTLTANNATKNVFFNTLFLEKEAETDQSKYRAIFSIKSKAREILG